MQLAPPSPSETRWWKPWHAARVSFPQTALEARRKYWITGRYGKLVPLGDTEAMAKAIVDTLDYPESPELLRTAAKKYFCDHIAAEYLTLPAFQEG